MEKFDIEKKEIFSLLTSKQIAELSEIAVIINFQEEQIIYDRKETASNLFVLLEGEVSLRIPGTKDSTTEDFSLEIEKVIHHGELFGTNFLFDVNTYKTRAKVVKPSKVMILDAKKFLNIIRENESEFIIISYLAKVYFQRYVNAMQEFEECIFQTNSV